MTAFVGHSGAEKCNMNLAKIHDPQEGSIEIDNQNINRISLNSLRKTYL